MKIVEEYLLHAAECRNMARTAPQSHRQPLEQIAQRWEQLAEDRKRQMERDDRDRQEARRWNDTACPSLRANLCTAFAQG
jgi:hypothetical protein